MTSITILGATGSVGRSTLDLIEIAKDRFEVLAITANNDVSGLAELARRTGARTAVVADERRYPDLKEALSGCPTRPAAGEEAVVDAAASGADWTMAAIVGSAGLRPVMAALRQGRTVALANKEALVCAGDIMMEAVRASRAVLLPVDSEHNAIFQCLDSRRPDAVRRIILTASGGPFLGRSVEEMRSVTPAQAIAHPNWAMGAKISVDSATMMNKGLELIEAHHLFELPPEAFDVVIHPQSVIHGLVEYVDGSVLAQMASPDMRVPIAYALSWPERMRTPCERLDLTKIGRLDFQPPDLERFPALVLARHALREGGARPAILNAANEEAVASFLDSRLPFLDIADVAGQTLAAFDPPAPTSLEEVLEVDRESRRIARELIRKIQI